MSYHNQNSLTDKQKYFQALQDLSDAVTDYADLVEASSTKLIAQLQQLVAEDQADTDSVAPPAAT